jgi:hypothetical protein
MRVTLEQPVCFERRKALQLVGEVPLEVDTVLGLDLAL